MDDASKSSIDVMPGSFVFGSDSFDPGNNVLSNDVATAVPTHAVKPTNINEQKNLNRPYENNSIDALTGKKASFGNVPYPNVTDNSDREPAFGTKHHGMDIHSQAYRSGKERTRNGDGAFTGAELSYGSNSDALKGDDNHDDYDDVEKQKVEVLHEDEHHTDFHPLPVNPVTESVNVQGAYNGEHNDDVISSEALSNIEKKVDNDIQHGVTRQDTNEIPMASNNKVEKVIVDDTAHSLPPVVNDQVAIEPSNDLMEAAQKKMSDSSFSPMHEIKSALVSTPGATTSHPGDLDNINNEEPSVNDDDQNQKSSESKNSSPVNKVTSTLSSLKSNALGTLNSLTNTSGKNNNRDTAEDQQQSSATSMLPDLGHIKENVMESIGSLTGYKNTGSTDEKDRDIQNTDTSQSHDSSNEGESWLQSNLKKVTGSLGGLASGATNTNHNSSEANAQEQSTNNANPDDSVKTDSGSHAVEPLASELSQPLGKILESNANADIGPIVTPKPKEDEVDLEQEEFPRETAPVSSGHVAPVAASLARDVSANELPKATHAPGKPQTPGLFTSPETSVIQHKEDLAPNSLQSTMDDLQKSLSQSIESFSTTPRLDTDNVGKSIGISSASNIPEPSRSPQVDMPLTGLEHSRRASTLPGANSQDMMSNVAAGVLSSAKASDNPANRQEAFVDDTKPSLPPNTSYDNQNNVSSSKTTDTDINKDNSSSYNTGSKTDINNPNPHSDVHSTVYRDKAAEDALKELNNTNSHIHVVKSSDGQEDCLPVRKGFENFTGFGVKCIPENQ
ncbi:hypothetical protein RMATCC62417_09859 [Rhizopus microsporus]|nr:hypothetical protein RMATCC62417_09859 [Rhizopus microsporus]